ncbi:FUSC family protein [Pigmentiphaga soli]|uniref:FUSC family protein n=1 Tax=Pigmentiphaga soli TaxID=1007095 RepID=A0ABP8HQI8_9BURK
MKPITAEEALFSAKTFAGAMLALYISYGIGLPRPFWAMMTAYVVVTQPWAGAIRSKAAYRLAGTALGSTATVYMVPRLASYPVLMTGAIALWVGACLFVALLDRTPRSYVFMLAGYTAALIGFPSVSTPDAIFDTALARVEEIGLGIVCASLVHSIVLPRGVAPVVMGRLDAVMRDARIWLSDILQGTGNAPRRDRERRQLANDITQLRLLSTHIPYDVGNIRWTAEAVRAMQDRIAALTPLASAVEDRLRALDAAGEPVPAPMRGALAAVRAWLETGRRAEPDEALALRTAVVQSTPAVGADSPWRDLLLASLGTRLRELVDAYRDCLLLRRQIEAGLHGAPQRPMRRRPGPALHRDYGVALLSAVAAAVAICLCCAFWILTAWTNGSAAAMMAAVFCSFFATMDNPVPAIRTFLVYTVASIPISAVYLLAILPAVHSFEMLALTIFPVAFVLGALASRPALAIKAMATLFGVLTALSLQDTHTSDLVSFIDGMLGQLGGIATAALVTALLRTISAERAAQRIQAANWRELTELAGAARPPADGQGHTARMLDRIGLLQQRLALTRQGQAPIADDALQDLRVGTDIVALQHARGRLPQAGEAIQAALRELAQWYRARQAGRAPAAASCLARIDGALAHVTALEGPARAARDQAIVALIGIRRGLFPEAGAPAAVAAGAPQP